MIVFCEFNMDTVCVELKFDNGAMIAIDTIAVENEIADNMYERSSSKSEGFGWLDMADLQRAAGIRQTDSERRSGEVFESGYGVQTI